MRWQHKTNHHGVQDRSHEILPFGCHRIEAFPCLCQKNQNIVIFEEKNKTKFFMLMMHVLILCSFILFTFDPLTQMKNLACVLI